MGPFGHGIGLPKRVMVPWLLMRNEQWAFTYTRAGSLHSGSCPLRRSSLQRGLPVGLGGLLTAQGFSPLRKGFAVQRASYQCREHTLCIGSILRNSVPSIKTWILFGDRELSFFLECVFLQSGLISGQGFSSRHRWLPSAQCIFSCLDGYRASSYP